MQSTRGRGRGVTGPRVHCSPYRAYIPRCIPLLSSQVHFPGTPRRDNYNPPPQHLPRRTMAQSNLSPFSPPHTTELHGLDELDVEPPPSSSLEPIEATSSLQTPLSRLADDMEMLPASTESHVEDATPSTHPSLSPNRPVHPPLASGPALTSRPIPHDRNDRITDRSERMPRNKDARVYVGNLPFHVGWQDLKDFMRAAGDVAFANILTTPYGQSKGCGIVEYASAEEARIAMDTLNDKEFMGRPVFIREDREEGASGRGGGGGGGGGMRSQGAVDLTGRQIFVGNLPYAIAWQDLKDLFRTAGNVVRADVQENPDGRSKGTGIVVFETVEEANNAIAMYNDFDLHGRKLEVREDRFPGRPPMPSFRRGFDGDYGYGGGARGGGYVGGRGGYNGGGYGGGGYGGGGGRSGGYGGSYGGGGGGGYGGRGGYGGGYAGGNADGRGSYGGGRGYEEYGYGGEAHTNYDYYGHSAPGGPSAGPSPASSQDHRGGYDYYGSASGGGYDAYGGF